MSVALSSELVVGNLLIEAVREGRKEVSFFEILKYEDELNKRLIEGNKNCYSDVLVEDVADTVGVSCRYFHERNGSIRIEVEDLAEEEKDSLITRLITFFRNGISEWLTTIIKAAWEAVFAA